MSVNTDKLFTVYPKDEMFVHLRIPEITECTVVCFLEKCKMFPLNESYKPARKMYLMSDRGGGHKGIEDISNRKKC